MRDPDDLNAELSANAAYIASLSPQVILRLVRIAEAAMAANKLTAEAADQLGLKMMDEDAALRDALEGVRL